MKGVTKMNINYDVEKINRVLEDFHRATGVNMDLYKEDFTRVGVKNFSIDTEYCSFYQGTRACETSDRELLEKCRRARGRVTHVCHGGLMNVAIPIIYSDSIIGYIAIGQMRIGDEAPTPVRQEAYSKLPFFDEEKINSVSNLAEVLLGYILIEKMLSPTVDENLEKAVSYISSNLKRDLSIDLISSEINLSKSVLYRLFHNSFRCTVGGYITKKRIEMALSLMENTSLSMEEISEEVGFSSASYFCKSFKNEMGMSPLKYKKSM